MQSIDLKLNRESRPELILKIDEETTIKDTLPIVVPEPYKLEWLPSSQTLIISHCEKVYPAVINLDLDDLAQKINSNYLVALANSKNIEVLPVRPDIKTRTYEYDCQQGILEKIALYEGDFTEGGFRWRENHLEDKSGPDINLKDRKKALKIWARLYNELKERIYRHPPAKQKAGLKSFSKIFNKVRYF